VLAALGAGAHGQVPPRHPLQAEKPVSDTPNRQRKRCARCDYWAVLEALGAGAHGQVPPGHALRVEKPVSDTPNKRRKRCGRCHIVRRHIGMHALQHGGRQYRVAPYSDVTGHTNRADQMLTPG
jgi:ribosomal protein S14